MRLRSVLIISMSALLSAVPTVQSQGPDRPGGGGGFGGGGGGFGGGGFGGRRGDGFGGNRGDPGQMFDRLSQGKDVITRDSLDNPWMQGMFDRLAEAAGITNGRMTRDQFIKASEQVRQNFGGGFGGRGPGGPNANQQSQDRGNNIDARAEQVFNNLDANKDGVLNYDEMPEELRAEREKWDTDKNGLISLDEFKAYFRARMEQRRQNRESFSQADQALPDSIGVEPMAPQAEEEEKKPIAYRAGKLPKELPAWFDQYDTDRDGQIGLYEWKATGRSIEEFNQIDRNGDGFLTVDEVLRYERINGRLAVATTETNPSTSSNPAPGQAATFGFSAGASDAGNPGGALAPPGPGNGSPGTGRWGGPGNGPPWGGGNGQFWRGQNGGGMQFGPNGQGGGDRRGRGRGGNRGYGDGNFSQSSRSSSSGG